MKPTYEELVISLEETLNYIEHKVANEGRSSTDAEWDANVVEFRETVSYLGIGRSYTDKAAVNLKKIREQLKAAKR